MLRVAMVILFTLIFSGICRMRRNSRRSLVWTKELVDVYLIFMNLSSFQRGFYVHPCRSRDWNNKDFFITFISFHSFGDSPITAILIKRRRTQIFHLQLCHIIRRVPIKKRKIKKKNVLSLLHPFDAGQTMRASLCWKQVFFTAQRLISSNQRLFYF